MSRQIVGTCPQCGRPIFSYPTYPVGWKKVHISCNCLEMTDYCFASYYASMEQFANDDIPDDAIY